MEASEESFPASDPPAFVSTTGSRIKKPGSSKSDAEGKKAEKSRQTEAAQGSRKERP